MARYQDVNGYKITIRAAMSAAGHPIVTVAVTTPPGSHVAELALAYPMRSKDAARQFVAQADESTFHRAWQQLEPHIATLNLFERGLEQGLNHARAKARSARAHGGRHGHR